MAQNILWIEKKNNFFFNKSFYNIWDIAITCKDRQYNTKLFTSKKGNVPSMSTCGKINNTFAITGNIMTKANHIKEWKKTS